MRWIWSVFIVPWLLLGREMTSYLPFSPLIFDVGAYHGEKTEKYLRLGARKVICIEPQASCVAILKRKFGYINRVVILELAASDKIGTIPFYINSRAKTISTADLDWQMLTRFTENPSWDTWDIQIEIPTTTLDALIEMYGVPDFCKIDVEGHELFVLKGLTQPIPYMSFEYVPELLDQKTVPCLDHLETLGCPSYNVCFNNTETIACSDWMDREALLGFLRSQKDPGIMGDIYVRLRAE